MLDNPDGKVNIKLCKLHGNNHPDHNLDCHKPNTILVKDPKTGEYCCKAEKSNKRIRLKKNLGEKPKEETNILKKIDLGLFC